MINNILIVTNFNAGRKKAVKYKKIVIDFVLRYTKSFKFVDIDELKELDVEPFDTIIAMGGDGTVNRVLPYLSDGNKVLGIIPCGTANLLAAKLGLSYNIKMNLEIISRQNIKKIDIQYINSIPYILRSGLGWDADLICKTPQSLKNRFGYFAYLIAGVLFALRLKKKEYCLNIDEKSYKVNASCIIFSNAANMYRNYISLAKNSSLEDGLIDIFILKTTNPVRLFFEFLAAMFGLCKNSSAAEYIKAKKIKLETNWLVFHTDGEKHILKNDADISIRQAAIQVFSK